MKNFKKLRVFVWSFFLLTSIGCSKEEQVAEERLQTVDNKVTIDRLVEITNNQTTLVRNEIEVLSSRKARMNTLQYDNFVRGHVEQLCREIVAIDPAFVVDDNFQVDREDPNDWTNDPIVFGGDVETVVPSKILTRFDVVADKLQAIDNNPIYDSEDNLNDGGVAIENVLQTEIHAIKSHRSLTLEEKQLLCDAFETSKALVQPEVEYFKTLAA